MQPVQRFVSRCAGAKSPKSRPQPGKGSPDRGEHNQAFCNQHLQSAGYTLDDVRDKINACLPERYMRPVEIFTVPERPFFHFKTNRIGLSKEIIAKRNQQKEKAKRNSFADGCIA